MIFGLDREARTRALIERYTRKGCDDRHGGILHRRADRGPAYGDRRLVTRRSNAASSAIRTKPSRNCSACRAKLIKDHGAVSEAVVRAMAAGCTWNDRARMSSSQ